MMSDLLVKNAGLVGGGTSDILIKNGVIADVGLKIDGSC
jgi:predicted amidohydrolase